MEAPAWMGEVIIRTAELNDLPALEWDGEYIYFRELYRQVYEKTQEGTALIWVAEIEHTGLLGQVFVQLNSGRRELADGLTRSYIYGFRIKAPYRNSGLGTRMLMTVEQDLLARQFCWATLNVGRENKKAFDFYRRCGYSVVGAEPGNWSYMDHLGLRREVHEPAWRMEKRIR